MDSNEYTLERLVTELREARALASSQGEVIGRVQAIAQRAAAQQRAWLRDEMCQPDAEQGFGFHCCTRKPGTSLPSSSRAGCRDAARRRTTTALGRGRRLERMRAQHALAAPR